MIYRLSFLLCFIATTIYGQCVDNATLTGQNCFNGQCYGTNDNCACASGSTGASCQNQVAANCSASFATLDNLATNNYPTLVEGPTATFYFADTLNILVESPLVTDRLRTIVYLNDYENHTQCAYPAGPFWTKSFDEINCVEQYRAAIPWNVGSGCGWSEDSSEEGYVSYRGYVYMEHLDQLDVFRGDVILRDTVHVMPIKIKFKTQVVVSTDISVFAPVNLLAAIVEQTYNPITNEGDLEFRTSLQWPFYLDNVLLNDHPVNMTASIREVPFDCPALSSTSSSSSSSTDEPACDQLWHIDINPITACTLSGIYNLSFTVNCVPGVPECPLISGSPDNNIEIIGTVVSENFCTEIALDIGLTGTMDSYEDAAYLIQRSAFLYDQTAYFGIELSTDGAATIETSTIQDVRIYDAVSNSSNFMMQAESITASGTASSFAVDASPPSPSEPGFNFVIGDDSTFVAEDQNADFTVFAVVDVTFTGGVGSRYNFNFDHAKRQFDDSEERNGGSSQATASIGAEGPASAANSVPQSEESQQQQPPTESDEVEEDSASALFLSMIFVLLLC